MDLVLVEIPKTSLSLRRIIMIQSIGKLKAFHDDLYFLFLDSIYKHVLLCTCSNIDFNICLIFDKQILQCIILKIMLMPAF